ncbi:MAG: hypothetical protein K0Q79_383 [Flavipsychrobacter sp.]|jgi:uncharacterized protein with HEPN domain|nr:hypothetical protein [Flavipsychrobacter sp.]
MSKREASLLLGDILVAADKIVRYTNGLSFELFAADEKTIDAVVRNFEIIGEAANRLSEEFKDAHSTVDWHRLRGFRNRIVHDYMGIDYGIVWMIIAEYLPLLIADIERIIDTLH